MREATRIQFEISQGELMRQMMGGRKFLALALGLALGSMAGCSTTAGPGNAPSWNLYESTQAGQKALGDDSQALRLVFYRIATGDTVADLAPLNVYVNGHYQASLIGLSYSDVLHCPGQVTLSAASNDVRNEYLTKESGSTFTLTRAEVPATASQPAVDSGNVKYFQVLAEGPQGGRIIPVPMGRALGYVNSMARRQDHTISRVKPVNCATTR